MLGLRRTCQTHSHRGTLTGHTRGRPAAARTLVDLAPRSLCVEPRGGAWLVLVGEQLDAGVTPLEERVNVGHLRAAVCGVSGRWAWCLRRWQGKQVANITGGSGVS